MRIKIISIFVFALFLANIIPVGGILGNFTLNNIETSGFGLQENGWLEEIDGVKVLHVSGTNYEMGYQHGSLLKEETIQNIRAFLNHTDASYEQLIDIWNIMKNYIPQEYIDEYQGIADGAGIPFNDIVAGYMTIVWSDIACFGISAWGSATKNETLYHLRSLDLPLEIQDPISGKFAYENSVLLVRNPDNGHASLCPTVAGAMHFGGGINQQGIAIGMQVCWSKDQTFHGVPAKLRTQMVLDYASSADDAINILTSNKTLGWNFVLSDAKIPIGYAVETCANNSYIGTYNNIVESKKPFWEIDHVIRRTNFFIDPTIASTQRDYYNPSTLFSFIRLLFRTNVFFAVWKSYQVMSIEIEKILGSMDLNSTMDMFRTGYSGKTSLIFYIIIKLSAGTSFNRSWNLWVADPLSGDMAVSFATKNKVAYKTPVHHFNLHTLLNSQPP
jgi:hypothetical protein